MNKNRAESPDIWVSDRHRHMVQASHTWGHRNLRDDDNSDHFIYLNQQKKVTMGSEQCV